MKKGFTLVEILAVIAILAVLTLLAINSMTAVREDSKASSVKLKEDTLLSADILYAQDHLSIFNNFGCEADDLEKTGDVIYCTIIDGFTLESNNYYEVDARTEDNKALLYNDVTGENMLEKEIIVYRKNNQILSVMR